MIITQDQFNQNRFDVLLNIEELLMLLKRTGPNSTNAAKILTELIMGELYEPCRQRKE